MKQFSVFHWDPNGYECGKLIEADSFYVEEDILYFRKKSFDFTHDNVVAFKDWVYVREGTL